MVAHDGGSSLDLPMGLLVVFSEVERVVNIDILKRRAHARNEKVKSASHVVEKEDKPFSASVFHGSLLVVMSDAQDPVQFGSF